LWEQDLTITDINLDTEELLLIYVSYPRLRGEIYFDDSSLNPKNAFEKLVAVESSLSGLCEN
jgi:hypothetical protein